MIRAADRWRAVDNDPTAACEAAAHVLTRLGDRDLAWDYHTTPVGLKPNESGPWWGLAETLGKQGDLDLADRAFRAASESEPTNPQILSLSPPLNLSERWLGAHPGYMLAKYGMTLATLGLAAEFARAGVAANCLWPQTMIATDAVSNIIGEQAAARARRPEVMADAAHLVLCQDAGEANFMVPRAEFQGHYAQHLAQQTSGEE